ncbi:hypothetical protein FB645_003141 [Coemansia sp. IMI 203386]|nr:hypothetical protein FB645_003141 [Coemansia sp. IMI 203386]
MNIEALVLKVLPLCHQDDIRQAVTNCLLSNSTFANIVRKPLKSKNVSPIRNQIIHTQPIIMERNKRWEKDETQRLLEYVSNVGGRVNWFACSRFVRTKTSDQCKSRYNNLKAKIPL